MTVILVIGPAPTASSTFVLTDIVDEQPVLVWDDSDATANSASVLIEPEPE